jgi:competence protein ComEC
MGAWLLPMAAAGFWAGAVLEGLGERGPGATEAIVLLVLGSASLLAGLAFGMRLPRSWLPVVAVCALVCFADLGSGWTALREARARGSPLLILARRAVRIYGALTDDPETHPLGWSASLDTGIAAWRTDGTEAAVRVHDALWLEGRGPPPRLRSGDRIRVDGSVELLRGNFGRYLRHRGYTATFQADQVELIGPPRNPVSLLARSLRSGLRRSLRRVFPDREEGLLMGLALGDTSRLDPGIEEDFRATGLSHLTAVSGENLAMFLAPVLALVGLLRLAPAGRLLVGGASVGFFVLLTGGEPSVLRAAAMASIVLVGVFLGRPRSPPAVMGGAVLGLLALNPTLVHSIGFQLSVGATVGMALLAGPVAERLRWMPSWLALPAGTTIGAQAGVTPLLLYHFGLVPTVTILANVLAFPAVGPGMLFGLAAGGAALVWLPMGLLLAALARVPLRYLEALSHALARSPLPWVTSSQGRAVPLALGAAAVGACAWWFRSGHGIPRRAATAGALLVPLLVWSGAVRAGPPAVLTVTFFSVGQGDAALVRSPSGANILIDAGPAPEEVARKLAALGIRRIDLAVATHPHADHVAGFPAVLARFRVTLAVDPGCKGDSPYYAEFLRAVRAAGVPFQHPRPGAALLVGDVRVDVLGPERCFVGTDSDPNNDSMVLRVTVGSFSVLFPGDAEREAQEDLLRDRSGSLAAQVLKVPHHGGDTSLDSFIAAVHARLAVVSVGPNRYGHPVPRVLAELAHDGMRVIRTDRAGDVTVTFLAGGKLLLRTIAA